jgi:hypothetical protein
MRSAAPKVARTMSKILERLDMIEAMNPRLVV